MALCLIKPVKSIRPCDITSPISKSLRAERSNPSMPASFHKYDMHIIDTLGSKSAALLFCALEYRFQKKPKGFYKFMSPCNNPYYNKGDSLSEELRVERTTVHRALKIICTSYKSKSSYHEGIKSYGEFGAFRGKPFLSYVNRVTRQTFYLRNSVHVEEVLKGTYESDLYVTKCNLSEVAKMQPLRSCKMQRPTGCKMQLPTTENTFQRIPLSLSLSSDDPIHIDSEQPEQPKEEEIKIEVEGNTEQPVPSVDIVSQMIETWRRVIQCDLSNSPNKSTVDNLSTAHKDVFGSTLRKWEEYCLLILSSKYLMGETIQKFKLNLAWAAKPETIIKITEGHYTTGDRRVTQVLTNEELNNLKLETENEINSLQEIPEFKQFRINILNKFGVFSYISYFKDSSLNSDEHKNINIVFKHIYSFDYMSNIVNSPHIWGAAKDLFKSVCLVKPEAFHKMSHPKTITYHLDCT